LSTNVGIAAPLLSRFDMVLVLLDSPEREWDQTVSEHILKSQMCRDDDEGVDMEDGLLNTNRGMWDLEKLQAYINYAKSFEPVLGTHAARVLTTFYKSKRNRDSYSSTEAGRTTLRLLESLIRISKAHARLMASAHVNVRDAVVAISLVEMSMQMQSAVGDDSVLHKDFPMDPDKVHKHLSEKLLTDLNLEDLNHLTDEF